MYKKGLGIIGKTRGIGEVNNSNNQMIILPQNLLTANSSLLEDFETFSDWTVDSGSGAVNTTQYKTGTQSLLQTSAVGGASNIRKSLSNLDLSNFGRMSFWIYIHDTMADYNWITLTFYNNTAQTNGMRYQLKSLERQAGWNLVNAPQNDFTVIGSGTWASPMVRMNLNTTAKATKTVRSSWDSLYYGAKGMSTVMITIDDWYPSAYTIAYQYMKNYNMVGTMFVTTGSVGASNISISQLKEMYNYGWAICNHTRLHTDLTSLAEEDQETEINNGKNDLISWGLTKGANFLAYPTGLYNSDTFTALANCGVLMARDTTSYNAGGRVPCLPPYDIRLIEAQVLNSGVTLATATAAIDDAILQGNPINFFMHDIGGASQITIADFYSLIDYIHSKRSLIYSITFIDYYNLTLGSVVVRK